MITNRTDRTVRFALARPGMQPRDYALEPGRSLQVSTAGEARIGLAGGEQPIEPGRNYVLRAGASGRIELAKTGQPRPAIATPMPAAEPPISAASPSRAGSPSGAGLPSGAGSPSVAASPNGAAASNALGVAGAGSSPLVQGAERPAADAAGSKGAVRIGVRILVDEEETTRDHLWQERLRARLEAASDLFERAVNVRFYVAGYGRWTSTNEIADFAQSLAEFERTVTAGPGQIAIGFTSQYPVQLKQTDLGGTRAPLHTHILIRELSTRINEPERLEVLVHELGHYLGAVHSSRADSVMRPILGDRQSRSVKFEIGFDAENVRIMQVVAAELAERRVRHVGELSAGAKATLSQLYRQAAQAQPKDPAAPYLLHLLRQ